MARPKVDLGYWSVSSVKFVSKYPLMDIKKMSYFLVEAQQANVAPAAFEKGGFIDLLFNLKKWDKLPLNVAKKRERTLNCLVGMVKRTGSWRDDYNLPTRLLISCYCWGFDPEENVSAFPAPIDPNQTNLFEEQ